MASTTKRKSRNLTCSSPRDAIQEEVVYYSFSLPRQYVLQFFNHRVDAHLADIEEDCKCSILVNSRRTRQQQRQHRHRSSVAANAAAATAAAADAADAADMDSTVEVLLEEAAGNFGRSVSRLSELVRGFGGHLKIRRLIKKLSLADGSKKYCVEQPRRSKEVLSPDSGTLDGSGTTAAEAASAATPASSSVVMSFADEAEGHWSLYSMVTPFMDLVQPKQSRELARTLWIPAARLLADCTRLLVTEAVAGELISFSSYSKSGFDASLGDIISTDGDSPMDDSMTEGGRNFSHEPKPGITLLVTALLGSRAPPGRDETIDNFVSSASNSLNFTRERQSERLQPSFTEPLLLNKTTECRPGLHGAQLRQRASAAVSTCCTNYAAPKLTRACQSAAHISRNLSQAAHTCLPYRQSRQCGTLGESLACSGPASSACQHTERLGQAAGSASQLGRLSELGALPACRMMLTSGLINSHVTVPASQLGSLGHSNSAGTPLRLLSSCQTVGHHCDRASMQAATACCEEATPAAAWKSTLTGECADSSRMASLLHASLRPGHSSAKGVRHPAMAASATGHSATCHVRARADESVLAGCEQDSATAHVTVCQNAANARYQTVGLPRLRTADVAVTPSCQDERSAAAAFQATSASHHQLCSSAACNAALGKRKHSATGAEATTRITACPDGRFEEPSEVIRAPRRKCPASGLHRTSQCENCAHLRVVPDESSARFEAAGSEGLCQFAADTAVKGFACSDCPVSAAALKPLLSSSNASTAFYNMTSATGGLLRSDSQHHSGAVDSLCPIECCDSVLPALAPTLGVRGISCEYQLIPSTSTSATYSLTFSQVTELSECSALGARRQCAGLRFASDSAVFPQGCSEPHAERAERCADAAPGHQTAETDWRVGPLTLPMIQLHGHGKDSCAVCVSNAADCALLSLDELKSSRWTGLNEVMETSISLAAAANCDGACTGLVNGPAWCHHGQEAACQVRVFERGTGQLISGQCWHQLVDAIAGTAGALEWAVAWPAGRQSAVVLMEQTASMLAGSARKSRQKDPGTVSVPRGDVRQCSELVWKSRKRIQLMQDMLN